MLHTVLGHAVLVVFNALILLLWALYNHLRFAGNERRQAAPGLSDLQLASSFSVTPGQIAQLRRARVAQIQHGADGEILTIEEVFAGPGWVAGQRREAA
jgi:biofilm PGA synthesis protein PgaD